MLHRLSSSILELNPNSCIALLKLLQLTFQPIQNTMFYITHAAKLKNSKHISLQKKVYHCIDSFSCNFFHTDSNLAVWFTENSDCLSKKKIMFSRGKMLFRTTNIEGKYNIRKTEVLPFCS